MRTAVLVTIVVSLGILSTTEAGFSDQTTALEKRPIIESLSNVPVVEKPTCQTVSVNRLVLWGSSLAAAIAVHRVGRVFLEDATKVEEDVLASSGPIAMHAKHISHYFEHLAENAGLKSGRVFEVCWRKSLNKGVQVRIKDAPPSSLSSNVVKPIFAPQTAIEPSHRLPDALMAACKQEQASCLSVGRCDPHSICRGFYPASSLHFQEGDIP